MYLPTCYRKEAVDMLNTLAVKKLKVECDTNKQINNRPIADETVDASRLKRTEMVLDSRESLPVGLGK